MVDSSKTDALLVARPPGPEIGKAPGCRRSTSRTVPSTLSSLLLTEGFGDWTGRMRSCCRRWHAEPRTCRPGSISLSLSHTHTLSLSLSLRKESSTRCHKSVGRSVSPSVCLSVCLSVFLSFTVGNLVCRRGSECMERRRSSVAGAVSRGGALTRAAENNNDFFFRFWSFFSSWRLVPAKKAFQFRENLPKRCFSLSLPQSAVTCWTFYVAPLHFIIDTPGELTFGSGSSRTIDRTSDRTSYQKVDKSESGRFLPSLGAHHPRYHPSRASQGPTTRIPSLFLVRPLGWSGSVVGPLLWT